MSDDKAKGHTALPWNHSHGEFDEPCVFDSHGRVIAGCDNPQFSPEECKANAALIVRAVNCHEDLVKALEGVIAVADRKTDEFDRAKAVLARAKEQTP